MNNQPTTIVSDHANLSAELQHQMHVALESRLKGARWTVHAMAVALDEAGFTPAQVDAYLEETVS